MTARSVIRLLPEHAAVSGSVTFDNRSVLDLGPEELRRFRSRDVAMVFQDPRAHIDQTWTIGSFLRATLAINGLKERRPAERRARELLNSVHIDNADRRMRQYPYEVSGGMLQRVMIAAALAADPRLLLADEPTTALDVTVQAEIVRVLGELRAERGLSMLFITHDLELAEVACDRMAVMYAGRIVEELPVQGVADTARHPYTIGLLGARPDIAGRARRLSQLPGRPLFAHETQQGCSFASRCAIVMDECREASPPLHLVDGHAVACLRAAAAGDLLGTGPSSGTAEVVARRVDHSVVIGVRNLSRTFGSTAAVNDISFELRRGDSLAIVGESGSGKTTVARILVGLDRATSGSVEIEGRERRGRRIAGLSYREGARKVQIVFQDPYGSLDPRQRIGAAIAEVARFADDLTVPEARRRAIELLGLVGLDEGYVDRFPRRLSGGQRQRAAIARALAARPEVLVLDEAVAALDVSIQAQVLNLLADLREQLGVTYVFITHDLAVVRQVADRVLVMRHGNCVETGDVDQILTRPRDDYTIRLVNSSPTTLLRHKLSGPAVEEAGPPRHGLGA